MADPENKKPVQHPLNWLDGAASIPSRAVAPRASL
jgi:hypothetical protein